MESLILIDVQNDFMPGGALPVPEGNDIIPAINTTMSKFDLIIATQDWHPAGHSSFASSHSDKHPFDVIEHAGVKQTLWPDHCVQQTPGADFHPDLNQKPIQAIFQKGTNKLIDSYSGFYDNHRQSKTGLADYLHEKQVTRLYFAGLAADICVYYTIQDALELGFSCALIESATRALDAKQFAGIKQKLLHQQVQIIR